ncbi:MAG: hypothetical protein AAGE13_11190 [Pseudomonadota bacterium]
MALTDMADLRLYIMPLGGRAPLDAMAEPLEIGFGSPGSALVEHLPPQGLIALGTLQNGPPEPVLRALDDGLPPGLYATAAARACLSELAPGALGFSHAGISRPHPDGPELELWRVGRPGDAAALPRSGAIPAGGPAEALDHGSGPPSLAVLAFRAPGGSAAMHGQAYSLSDDVRLCLTRFRALSVLGGDTVRAWRASNLPAREIGRRLGVAHVLEGVLRSAGTVLRLDATLVETATGRAIWAERYLREPNALFGISDDIAERMAAAIAGFFEEAAQLQAEDLRRAPAPLDGRAFDLALQARAHLNDPGPDGLATADMLAAAALDLEPGNTAARLVAAQTAYRRWQAEAAASDLGRAALFAGQVLAADPFDARARLIDAEVNLARQDHAAAEASFAAALDLNPADAEMLARVAAGWACLGRAAEGLQLLQRAKVLNPFFPDRYLAIEARLHLVLGAPEDAVRAALRMQDPATARADLVIAYKLSARRRAAAAQVERLLAETPGFETDRWLAAQNIRDADIAARLADALRDAGLP